MSLYRNVSAFQPPLKRLFSKSKFITLQDFAFTPKISVNEMKTNVFSFETVRHSGHNKWSKIRHAKGATDLKRGTMFAKMGLVLISAIRAGGPDPKFNLRLATALERSKALDIPKKNIENAFKRAAGLTENPMDEIVYQAMGPHQVAVVIETYTDNKNRTIKNIRTVLNRSGGTISDVSWMFKKKGKVILDLKDTQSSVDIDAIMNDVIEAGGEDFEEKTDEDGQKTIEVICEFESLSQVAKSLQRLVHYQLQSIAPFYHFNSSWEFPESENQETVEEEVQTFLDSLESLEDVVRVHTNIS